MTLEEQGRHVPFQQHPRPSKNLELMALDVAFYERHAADPTLANVVVEGDDRDFDCVEAGGGLVVKARRARTGLAATQRKNAGPR